MNRRRSERVSKRVEVRFWQVGQKVQHGYSTNISSTGMHIATANPLPPRARLRIEVLHGEHGFLIEGVVAHRRAVHPELAKVTQPGMGVRFMTPIELLRELYLDEQRGAGPAGDKPESPPAGGEAEAPAPVGETRTFIVRFASPKDFLGIYERDIVNGGLFVATSRPAGMREVVQIELQPPHHGAEAVVLPARVVRRFQPPPGTGAILVGMGVELLDPTDALARLRPVVERLAGLAAEPGLLQPPSS
jgi:PilZ domain